MVGIFCNGRVIKIENFHKTQAYSFKKVKRTFSALRQDKGHSTELKEFVDRVSKCPVLIPLNQIVNVGLASFAVVTSARERRLVDFKAEYSEVVELAIWGYQPA